MSERVPNAILNSLGLGHDEAPPGLSISFGSVSETSSDPGLSAALKVAASKWRFNHRVDAALEPGRRAHEQWERLTPANRNVLDGEQSSHRVRAGKVHPLTAHPKVEAHRIQELGRVAK